MPTVTDIAICIRHWDFSETSQTVSLFTRCHGVVRGLAKGAKRPKGSFSGGIDVLTRGQVVAILKPGRELATITAWHLEDMHRHLRESLAANRAGLYMADLVHHMVIDHDPHEALFDALAAALSAVADPNLVDHQLLAFQWTLLRETGYQPELERDVRTGRPLEPDAKTLGFDPKAGGVVAAPAAAGAAAGAGGPGEPWRVRRETVELLGKLSQAGQPAPDWPRATVRRASSLLAAYVREIIGQEPASMRWAFSDPGT